MKKKLLTGVLLALTLFCAAGAGYLVRDGGAVDVSRVRGEDFSAVLYRPASATEADPAPAVLVAGLKSPERRALAMELSRRGWVALTAAEAEEGSAALAWLEKQPFVRSQRLAVAGDEYALILGEDGGGSVRAVIALWDESFSRQWEELPNLLLFAECAPAGQELAAFLRCGEDRARPEDIQGYFYEETARCLRITEGAPSFRDPAVQAAVFDWLGSSLGHRLEIPDSAQRWQAAEGLRIGAICCAGVCTLSVLPVCPWKKKKTGSSH